MVVNILYELPEEFEVDVSSARSVVLKKCSQFHIDETGAKFIGKNFQTFLVSNKFYTSYSTGPDKNLWSVAVAMIGGVQQFIINNTAVNFIA